ncbi:ECF RNA polymerase sigma factor SigE [Polystyrenella longa]|uniref:ECF RNA polymerase sigma factor SigE n=1 Tax=Polystyrenella longa TaxID=2528007 RepID=A0A518CIQ3_9PLAN|nr:RNA polymerase sigma factor [Polystyrenella longa]QDU79101.1 ECF RNA polymerase sigma factor SigE [Polystyrenella longa]
MSSSESTPQLITDAELLHSIREQQDQVALQTLVEKHSTLLMSVCAQILHDQNDAEDAFQNIVITFVKDASKIKEPQYVSSWLYRVAQRESFNILRKRKRMRTEPLRDQPVETNAIVPVPEKREELIALHEEMDQIPEKFRSPLILCYLEGKSRQEAAFELNVTVSSIKASLASGRDLLRKRLLQRGIVLAWVLSAWNSSQVSAGVTVSAALAQQAMSSGVASSTGSSSLVTSMNSSGGTVVKGATYMTMGSTYKILAWLVFSALILGGAAAVINFDDPLDDPEVAGEVPVKVEEIESEELGPEVLELIEKLKEKEPLYRNFDVTMHFTGDQAVMRNTGNRSDGMEQRQLVQHIHQQLRKVIQGEMIRTEFDEEVVSFFTESFDGGQENIRNQTQHKLQIETFDGESTTSVAVTPEDPMVKMIPNPYQVCLGERPDRNVPLSDLFQGGEHATKMIQAKSEKPYPASARFMTSFVEYTELAGEPVIVVHFDFYLKRAASNRVIQKDRIYLAINKNYIPMRWELDSKVDPTKKNYYQVLTWSEPEEGVWFPETAESIRYEKQGRREVNYSYDVTTLNPEYPKAFFQVEESANSDEVDERPVP